MRPQGVLRDANRGELNSSGLNRQRRTPGLEEWLAILRGQGGSDLYLVAGLPPSIRVQLSCLASIHRHLLDGGVIIVDVFNPSLDFLVNRPIGEEFGDEPEFSTPDGRRITRRHKTVAHDRFNQVNHFELVYHVIHPDGRQERLVHAFPLRYLFRFEAEHLMARAGFQVEHLYADYDKSPYGSKYPGELILVARKTPRRAAHLAR